MLFVDLKQEAKIYSKEYLKALERVVTSGWYILGQEVEAFEKELAKYLDVKHVVGVANGLEALQISLMALDIGKGDEVITTPLSAVATTLAILAVGATPVFIDTDKSGQINISKIEKGITSKTKAILPVHLYGNALHLDKLQQITNKHNLFLIEDAAQAHGSEYQGKKLGSIGNIGCFSFYPTKNLGAIGDAGALATNNDSLAKNFRQLRDYGQASKYEHTRYGLNSRLDELQAALLREKLKHLDELNAKRLANAKLYWELFEGVNGIQCIRAPKDSVSNIHQFVIKVQNRDIVQQKLKEDNIPTLVHYPILIPRQPMFKHKYSSLKLPIADHLVKEILSLPCGPFLTQKEVKLVAKAIIELQ